MGRAINTLIGFALPVSLLFWARPTSAGIHQVWDEAHFFKPETIVQVDQVLADIHGKYHKDLMIETFVSIPDDFKAKYQENGKAKFFEDWSMSEGRELQLNGLLILICGEPRHIQVALGVATRQKAFTETDRDELLQIITSAFRQKEFDRGIVAGVEFVRDRMDKNLSDTSSPTTRPTTRPAAEGGGTSRESK